MSFSAWLCHLIFGLGVPIIAPSVKFLMSLYDAHPHSAQIYPPDDVVLIRKRNPTGIYHHSPNNVGCIDEPLHSEPCCSDSSAADVPSLSHNASSPHQRSGCAALRASHSSPEACSRHSLVEWLPRIHTAVFPHVQQFDTVQELMEIMTDLASDDDFNLSLRRGMRWETMRLTLHNSGKIHALRTRLYSRPLTRSQQMLQFVSRNRSKENQAALRIIT